jgi:hypothetical protein
MHTNVEVVDKILWYLKKSPGQGIIMRTNKTNSVIDYSDVDWADNYDRKSITDIAHSWVEIS